MASGSPPKLLTTRPEETAEPRAKPATRSDDTAKSATAATHQRLRPRTPPSGLPHLVTTTTSVLRGRGKGCRIPISGGNNSIPSGMSAPSGPFAWEQAAEDYGRLDQRRGLARAGAGNPPRPRG